MNKELRDWIEAILSTIDGNNLCSEGKNGSQELCNQLIGAMITLSTYGVRIRYEINPYYFQDRKPSTFTAEIDINE